MRDQKSSNREAELTAVTRIGSGDLLASPRRIQLSRKAGWKMPPNTVKVSRPSKWGNPYKIGKSASLFAQSVDVPDAKTAVRLFEAYAAIPKGEYIGHKRGMSIGDQAYRELRGKNLACWCPLDQPCHADVLLRLANADLRQDAGSEQRA